MLNTALKIDSYGQTDTGLVRVRNEDAFLCDQSLNLYVVADGVGGLPNGALASALAVEMLHKIVLELCATSPIPWFEAFNTVNTQVHQRGVALNESTGMGTTLSAAVINNNILSYGHVGDTGIALFRDNQLISLTKNHTLGQQIIDQADTQAQLYIPEQFLHSLTRCIGQYGYIPVDTGQQQLQSADRILIYSDGVLCGWTQEELCTAFKSSYTAHSMVKKIIQQANARGGIDNCTAVAVFIK